MITQDIIARLQEAVVKEEAAVAGVPVKDTIKIADAEGYAGYGYEPPHFRSAYGSGQRQNWRPGRAFHGDPVGY